MFNVQTQHTHRVEQDNNSLITLLTLVNLLTLTNIKTLKHIKYILTVYAPVLRERLFSVAHLKGIWVIPETRTRVRRPIRGAG